MDAASLLFAAGHDPVAVAARVGDSIATVLRTYAREYDAARRRQAESDQLGALYDRQAMPAARVDALHAQDA